MRPYTIDELKNIISPIAEAHGVKRVSLFGSYAKGTASSDSDVDLIIDKGSLRTLYQFIGFRLEVEDALEIPVDMITSESSDTRFLDMISKEEILIYGES